MHLKKINLTKIIHFFILFFSLIAISYTFYRAEFIYEGNNRSYYFLYYLITIVNFLFWIILLFFKDEHKIIAIIFFISIYFSLFLIEISLHKFNINSNKDIKIIFKAFSSNVKFDTRNRLEIYRDLKKENNEVTLTFAPSNLIGTNGILYEGKKIFPLAGISKSETIYCNELGQYNIYQSDRHGFNNLDKIWETNNIEWGLIGDSYPHGACVDIKDNLAGKISHYSSKPSLNLGYSGNGTLINFAIIKEYLMLKKPKKVLFFYTEGNDLKDLNNELSSPILKKYLDKNFIQNLKDNSNQLLIDKKLRELIKKKYDRESKYSLKQKLKLMKIRLNYFKNFNAVDQDLDTLHNFNIPKEFKKILKESNKLINSYDGQLYFIYLPDYWSLKSDKNNRNYYNKKEVLNLVKSINIQIIDIHELFKNQNNPLSFFPFEEYGHYNVNGYDLIAKHIVDKILELENNK